MKSIIYKILAFAFAIGLVGCKEDELDHLNVTAVQNLYAPEDSKYVQLQSSSSASVLFEWELAKAEDGGLVMYEVAFDVEGGDFSNPIYKLASDNNGALNRATITHKTLNQIAALAGIESAATGKIQWTIISSKGINEMPSDLKRVLELTRLAGFADVPVDVFITGEASENGDDLASAIKMKSTATGEFEVYTQLTAGQSYYFVDRTSGTPRTFYIDGEVVKEDGTSTMGETAVYKINLDFNTGAADYTLVKNIELFFSPNNVYLFEIPYVGNGMWMVEDQAIEFKQESWGRDERYKFRMTVDNGNGDEYIWWGSQNADNSRPNDTTPDSFYYLYEAPSDQWSYTFKFSETVDMTYSDVILYFQADNEYTHEIIKKSDME
ncbi:SusE domain-containing protein [Chondrinema litorale]|uniref:SusE domain-containing protein n=1 Tax=Chondrinema litorale TaxID=2994555 RepID=UPI002542BDC3|nr:SusE domain-containing protein [Chondrinema litorale]UZR97552.1 SusE domain-containing protein [Chondrinema litorale]